MPLRDYQTALTAGVLYRVRGSHKNFASEQLVPSIEVIGGSGVSIYGAQVQPDSAPTGMYLTRSAFTGIEPFAMVPNYLYVSGTATSITVSGLDVEAV